MDSTKFVLFDVFKFVKIPSMLIALLVSLVIDVELVFSAFVALVISLFKLIVNVLSALVARLISFVKLVVNVFSAFVALVTSLLISFGKLLAVIDVIIPY